MITGISKVVVPRRAARAARRVPGPPQQQHFGWRALFEDPDGTRYALGQWDWPTAHT
jgi:hypothetical protein